MALSKTISMPTRERREKAAERPEARKAVEAVVVSAAAEMREPRIQETTDSRQPTPRMRHVALLIETSGSYGRGLLRGVAKYNREHARWSTYFHPHGLGDAPPEWMNTWEGDGILARVDTTAIADLLRNSGVPVVNLRGTVLNLRFPYVGPDHSAIAKLAAEHLLERGLKHFAFCGKEPGVHPGLDERGDSFKQTIEAAGFPCELFRSVECTPRHNWETEQDALAGWIAKLPKPVGVMACNDERGLQVLDACRRCGATVPDEVAVIGVDNDEYLCHLSIPPLTSVDVNAEQIGYEAAVLLDQMMQGKKMPTKAQFIAPRGIVTRLSTDVVASTDLEVNRALRFIRERGIGTLNVGDVLAHLGMSRASLQQRMKKAIGRTIHEEIERVRLARVKELLLIPDITIKQVARQTGFSSVQYMTRVFRAALGETPAKYRSKRAK